VKYLEGRVQITRTIQVRVPVADVANGLSWEEEHVVAVVDGAGTGSEEADEYWDAFTEYLIEEAVDWADCPLGAKGARPYQTEASYDEVRALKIVEGE